MKRTDTSDDKVGERDSKKRRAADRDLQHWWSVISVLLDVPSARNGNRVKRRKNDDGKQTRRARSRRRTN
jgi:hypothetical protein